MIDAKQLAKSFAARGRRGARVHALTEVSFHAPDGAITALLGPNGAGKTTALRVLSTLVRADSGQALVGGRDVALDPIGVRADLGILSDARGLYTRLSARENIRYFGALRGMPRKLVDERIAAMAALLEFEDLLDRRTDGFSTGERLKVALARALVHDPQHVILDEPTNGLDVVATRALRRLLLRLRDAGKCIVFSSHVMQEVDLLSDRIYVIAHGRTVADGSVSELLAQADAPTLEDAFIALAFGAGAPAAPGAQP